MRGGLPLRNNEFGNSDRAKRLSRNLFYKSVEFVLCGGNHDFTSTDFAETGGLNLGMTSPTAASTAGIAVPLSYRPTLKRTADPIRGTPLSTFERCRK